MNTDRERLVDAIIHKLDELDAIRKGIVLIDKAELLEILYEAFEYLGDPEEEDSWQDMYKPVFSVSQAEFDKLVERVSKLESEPRQIVVPGYKPHTPPVYGPTPQPWDFILKDQRF